MIYVASSWRNPYQQDVVSFLRDHGHEVYDFRSPTIEDPKFHWSEIDKDWKWWHPERFVEGLNHPLAVAGFHSDFSAMEASDTCVLVLPSGRSSHLEAGWFVGHEKRLFILLNEGGHTYSSQPCSACNDLDGCHGVFEPELMYKMASGIFCSLDRLLENL